MIIKHRRGLATEWAAKNPVVHAGEIGVETDTNRFKIGSGIHVWSELPYYQTTDEFHAQVAAYLEQIETTGGENSALITQLRNDAIDAKNDAIAAKNAAEAAMAGVMAGPFNGTKLTTQNLDTVVVPGVYFQQDSAPATLENNYPVVGVSGILEVFRDNPTNPTVLQRFTPRFGSDINKTGRVFYVRTMANGVLRPWRLYSSVEMSGSDVKLWDPASGAGKPLLAYDNALGQSDLNDVIIPGIYIQHVSGDATLAKNYPQAPNGGAWSIEVTRSSTGSGIIQVATRTWGADQARGQWIRTKGSTWTPWRFMGTVEAVTTAAPGVDLRIHDGVTARPIMPININLGVADLNTVTVPGFYIQPSSAAGAAVRNYPKDSMGGVLEVFEGGNAYWKLQRFTPFQGSAAAGRVVYIRRQTAVDSWQPWFAMPTQRVDNTAGRAIYTWDDTANREQLIYGDTGWRDIASFLVNGWTATSVSIRRTGSQVELRVVGLNASQSTSTVWMTGLPSGFQGWNGLQDAYFPVYLNANTMRTLVPASNFLMNGRQTTDPPINLSASYSVYSPWPTILPGNPMGAIPNL